MNGSTLKRAAAIVAGTAGGLLMLAPGAAQANVGYGATITPGGTVCVQQYANYQVRGEGTATKAGARFAVYRNGVQIYSTTNTTSGFAAEFRTAWWNFPGPGSYQVCAQNRNSTNTLVNIRILTDAEF
jgi:hypothetical protein